MQVNSPASPGQQDESASASGFLGGSQDSGHHRTRDRTLVMRAANHLASTQVRWRRARHVIDGTARGHLQDWIPRHSERRRAGEWSQGDEAGAVLVLALIFLVAVSLIAWPPCCLGWDEPVSDDDVRERALARERRPGSRRQSGDPEHPRHVRGPDDECKSTGRLLVQRHWRRTATAPSSKQPKRADRRLVFHGVAALPARPLAPSPFSRVPHGADLGPRDLRGTPAASGHRGLRRLRTGAHRAVTKPRLLVRPRRDCAGKPSRRTVGSGIPLCQWSPPSPPPPIPSPATCT